LHYKIIGASKKFKHQSRPLVRPSSLKFSQDFFNLSHETVPLKEQRETEIEIMVWRAKQDPRGGGGGKESAQQAAD
jgi:hypothetical protein